MIYTPYNGTDHTCTKINFRDFEISIAMDNRSLLGQRPLTRTTLIVYKDGKDVTAELPGITNVAPEGIRDCEGEDLFRVMQAIASLPVPADVSEVFSEIVKSARK